MKTCVRLIPLILILPFSKSFAKTEFNLLRCNYAYRLNDENSTQFSGERCASLRTSGELVLSAPYANFVTSFSAADVELSADFNAFASIDTKDGVKTIGNAQLLILDHPRGRFTVMCMRTFESDKAGCPAD